jgi:hypothetical protein
MNDTFDNHEQLKKEIDLKVKQRTRMPFWYQNSASSMGLTLNLSDGKQFKLNEFSIDRMIVNNVKKINDQLRTWKSLISYMHVLYIS